MNQHGHDDESQDAELRGVFTRLDPAARRPRYWEGLHRNVMDAARFELARRRRLTDLTISQTVTSWARTVVPSALVAAAAAAVILLVVPAPAPVVDVGIEELLTAGLDGEPIPRELNDEAESGVVFVAAEIF